jgi:DNA polymerase III subunit alpha
LKEIKKGFVMTTPKELNEIITQCGACGLGSLEKNLQSRKMPSGYHRSLFVLVDLYREHILPDQPSFELLRELFKKIGIDFDTMWKTTLVKCHQEVEYDNIVSESYITACMDSIFKNEISFVDPKVIFAIGEDAAAFLEVEFKLGVVQKSSRFRNVDIVVVQNPSLIVKGTETKESFIQQFKPIKADLLSIRDRFSFVNLHHHNQYSMRDGYGTEEQIADRLVELRSPGFCLTNHGNINAHYRQNLESKSRGIKPVFGTEFYYNPFRTDIMRLVADGSPDAIKERDALGKTNTYHLTVVAKNYDGYLGLIWLNNQAWENFYRFPLMSLDLLERLKGNVCVFSGCIAGYIPNHLRKEEYEPAIEEAIKFKDIFKDDFYLELMSTSYPVQKGVNTDLIQLAESLDIKTVITNDTHYVRPEHAEVHEVLQLSRSNKTYDDLNDPNANVKIEEEKPKTKRKSKKDSEDAVVDTTEEKPPEKKKGALVFEQKDYYIKDISDLNRDVDVISNDPKKAKEYLGKSIRNVNDIFAKKIEMFDMDKTIKLPKLGDDSNSLFVKLVQQGIEKRGLEVNDELIERLDLEISTIIASGYVDYFIVLEDIVRWAKEKFGRDCIGAGRGSAASSLVNYLLDITDVNPLKYPMMLFSRFLSPERPDMPDIDTDLYPEVRDAIIQYMIDKYGSDYVIPIGNMMTIKIRTALLQTLKVFGLPAYDANEITKNLPKKIVIDQDSNGNDVFGDPDVDDIPLSVIRQQYPALDDVLNEYPKAEEIVEALIGQIMSCGQHAGGVILSSVSLRDYIPIIRKTNGGYVSANTEGQYHELSDLGFVKYDMLGVTVLKQLMDTNKLIEKHQEIKINWHDVDELDSAYDEIYSLAQNGDLYGVFQIATPIGSRIMKMIHASNFYDIVATNALMRPGPLDMGMDREYAQRKLGRVEYEIHPKLLPILKDTYGIIIYQEQVMKICQDLGGFTGEESNILRKIMAKAKDKVATQQWKKKLIDGLIKNGFSEDESVRLWELIESFARYSFNTSHSICYSINSFRQLYQKYYFPLEFYTTLFNTESVDKVSEIISSIITHPARKFDKQTGDIREYRIDINPPNIRNLNFDFEIAEDEESINFGLGKLKGISQVRWSAIKQNLTSEDMNNVRVLLAKKYEAITVKGNSRMTRIFGKAIFETLVYSGAFDGFENEDGSILLRNDVIDIYNTLHKLKGDKAVEHIENEYDKNIREEECAGISFSALKEEKDILLLIRDQYEVGLEDCFFPDHDRVPFAVDFIKIECITSKTTKRGKKKKYRNIKVKKFGKNYSPIFIWDEKIKAVAGGKYVAMFQKEEGWVKVMHLIPAEDYLENMISGLKSQ